MTSLRRLWSSVTRRLPFAPQLEKMLNPDKVVAVLEPPTDAPLPLTIKNGVGHFTRPLQRLTFTYCPHNGDSRPLMDYLKTNLIQLARDNPSVEIVVSCRFSSRAKVVAFYNGDARQQRAVYVGGGAKTTARDVAEQVQRLRDASGMKARRFKMQVLSDTPAIRPIHSPFTNPHRHVLFGKDK